MLVLFDKLQSKLEYLKSNNKHFQNFSFPFIIKNLRVGRLIKNFGSDKKYKITSIFLMVKLEKKNSSVYFYQFLVNYDITSKKN